MFPTTKNEEYFAMGIKQIHFGPVLAESGQYYFLKIALSRKKGYHEHATYPDAISSFCKY